MGSKLLNKLFTCKKVEDKVASQIRGATDVLRKLG